MKENTDFKLYVSDHHFVIDFAIEPEFIKRDMPTTSKEPLCIGERFTKMHGRKTSAGFPAIDLLPGWEFEYCGMLEAELDDGSGKYNKERLVCFDVYKDGRKMNTVRSGKTLFDAGETSYFYQCFILKEFDNEKEGYSALLFFHTRGGSGRATETDTIVKTLVSGSPAFALQLDSAEKAIKAG